jgi:hypothetical protein
MSANGSDMPHKIARPAAETLNQTTNEMPSLQQRHVQNGERKADLPRLQRSVQKRTLRHSSPWHVLLAFNRMSHYMSSNQKSCDWVKLS